MQPFKITYRILPDHRSSTALILNLPRTPRRYRLASGALQHALLRPLAAFHRNFLDARALSGSEIYLRHAFYVCASRPSLVR